MNSQSDLPPQPTAASETSSFEQEIWNALRFVIDPELGVNIVDLGLIYHVQVVEREVHVVMTVTTPGCPMEHSLTFGIETAVLGIEGVTGVHVTVVHEPPWSPAMMSPEGRAATGIR